MDNNEQVIVNKVEQTVKQLIGTLEKQQEKRFEKVSRKATRSTLLMFVFLFIALAVVTLLASRYVSTINNRLDDLETTINVSAALTTQQVQPDEAIASLNSRLTSLESLQEAIVSTSKGALEQMNFVFAVVATFLGLFSFFFAYRQIMVDTSREGQDEEMRRLVGSFQDNITTINSLITTLEQSYAYRGEIQEKLIEMDERAALLEIRSKESDAVFDDTIIRLNSEAIKLFDTQIDRAGLSREENRRKLESFADRMNRAEATRKIEHLLNPFCYYLRGLGNLAIYQYEAAIDDFEIARTKGRADLSKTKSSLTGYREEDRENIDKYLGEMLVSCSHFQGVSYKNLGEYAMSKQKFQQALNRDPTHLRSKTYMLQVMFFDQNVTFETIELEYEKAIEEFKALESSDTVNREMLKRAFNTLKINQGNLYLKKSIPFDHRSGYKKFENQEKALKYFWEAYDFLDNDLAMFSVAQAMEGIGQSEWRRTTDQELYRKAMRILKRRVAQDHDHLYSVMLYYMLAICIHKLRDTAERPEVFLSQARHSLKQVPTHVTCFSPVNKIRLTRTEILEEMERFERNF